MKDKDHAGELRAMAQGVFRGLHEEAALLAGADALEASAKPAPKVLGEAWVARHADGTFCLKPSGALDLFGHPDGARAEAGSTGTIVRVQVVEVLW